MGVPPASHRDPADGVAFVVQPEHPVQWHVQKSIRIKWCFVRTCAYEATRSALPRNAVLDCRFRALVFSALQRLSRGRVVTMAVHKECTKEGEGECGGGGGSGGLPKPGALCPRVPHRLRESPTAAGARGN